MPEALSYSGSLQEAKAVSQGLLQVSEGWLLPCPAPEWTKGGQLRLCQQLGLKEPATGL